MRGQCHGARQTERQESTSFFEKKKQKTFDYFGFGSPGETEAEFADDEPLITYHLDGFLYGSGGGRSGRLAKPSYQAALSGKFRMVPDISWLADPFTGGIIALSVPNASPELQFFVYGSTSLACPRFSALWAIAQQAARPSSQKFFASFFQKRSPSVPHAASAL